LKKDFWRSKRSFCEIDKFFLSPPYFAGITGEV
jgi:hypothetical protein